MAGSEGRAASLDEVSAVVAATLERSPGPVDLVWLDLGGELPARAVEASVAASVRGLVRHLLARPSGLATPVPCLRPSAAQMRTPGVSEALEAQLGWLRIERGELLDADADALVISANNWLRAGSGAARAALDRAGERARATLRATRARLAPLARAAVVMLPGGDLEGLDGRRRYLVHTVTTWYDRSPDGSLVLVPTTPQHVVDATIAALREAAALGARTVALMPMCARPAYSVVPAEHALRVMGQAVLSAANELRVELLGRVTRVDFVAADTAAQALFRSLLPVRDGR